MCATYSKLTVYGQAIGITLESRRLDILDRIYGLTHDVSLLFLDGSRVGYWLLPLLP